MHNLITPLVKRSSTAFLQAVVVLIGIAAAAFLLWAPRVDGANANATLFQIYFNSFVAYVYLGSIPFFMALYQAFKLWGYAGRSEVFTPRSLRALRTLKYCALATIGVAAVSLIFMIGGDREDRPAGLFMRFLIAFPSIIAASAAATFERHLRSAIEGDGRAH